MKRTLKRELKVPEIAEREANGTSHLGQIASRQCDGWLLQRKRGSRFGARRVECFLPGVSASVHA